MSPMRKLVYKFLDLPHSMKLQVAEECGAWSKDDPPLNHPELEVSILQRVKAAGLLAEFEAKIDKILESR